MPLHADARLETMLMSMSAPSTTNPYALWLLPDFRRYACGSFAATFAQQAETLAVSVVLVETCSSEKAPLALGLMALVRACR